MTEGGYDPFAPGPVEIEVSTVTLPDAARGRELTCELWQPPEPGPLVVYSHHSGGHRRVAALLAHHLAGHGYRVAAVDHSETFVPELQPRDGEDAGARGRRIEAIVGSRVPDLGVVLDSLAGAAPVGLVGHSFGGWTVLAAADADPRVGAVVAMAPGGSEHPLPDVLRLPLTFTRSVPVLFLAGENDEPVPLDDVLDVYFRADEPRQVVVLRRADHQHFVDDVGGAVGLTAPEQAHDFVRGLTLAHLDAHLRDDERARAWLADGVPAHLAARGIEAWELPIGVAG